MLIDAIVNCFYVCSMEEHIKPLPTKVRTS